MVKEEIYRLTEHEAIKYTQSSINGLEETEAENRLYENGLNKLVEGKRKTFFSRFVEELKNVMIIVLIIAAVVSFVIAKMEGSSVTESIVIFAVVILNALLGVLQESNAEKAIDALKKMSAPYIKVRRDGKVESIKTEELVVGDIVLIEAGDFVPADMRIIQNNSLRIEEAALTGESLPVDKSLNAIEGDVALADRVNMLYSGSSVVYGRGEAVVTAVGMDTELGKIATELTNVKEGLTPLQRKLLEISKMLSIVVAIVGLAMVVLGVFQKTPFIEIFMLAVSLGVAAIPEGLPTSITIILSIGVQNMAKKNNIVRKLSSVETLGATEIICSDKTGTLTQNKMTVTEIYFNNSKYDVDKIPQNINQNQNYITFLKSMILCNDSKNTENDKIYLGDPTETALCVFAENQGVEKEIYDLKCPRNLEIPFDSVRKMMTTITKEEDEYIVYTKGAIESILERCNKIALNGQIIELTDRIKKEIVEASIDMSKKALRVLAFAYKEERDKPSKLTSEDLEKDLIYLGLVGMIDPPRPEVKAAVKKCYDAGMIPIMITGDNIDTAKAIAEDIGILDNKSKAITGKELDEMSDEEFKKEISRIRVYARVSPENKVRIVKVWKELGKTVAMTGDGVNDAPALKTADIGIGMGITGTEVSKSVASMVLADDNFATIVVAIEEGRKIYKNVQNVIAYLLASNISEVIIVFFATIFNSIIFNPLQLLWINLVTDTIPAISLGFEKADHNIMKQKPRKADEKFFTPFLTARILVPAIIKSTLVLLVYFVVEKSSMYNHSEAMTTAFIALILSELLFTFVVRSDRKMICQLGIFSNKKLLFGITFTIILQLVLLFVPKLGSVFNVVMLDTNLYIMAIGASLAFVILAEIAKLVTAKIFVKD